MSITKAEAEPPGQPSNHPGDMAGNQPAIVARARTVLGLHSPKGGGGSPSRDTPRGRTG